MLRVSFFKLRSFVFSDVQELDRYNGGEAIAKSPESLYFSSLELFMSRLARFDGPNLKQKLELRSDSSTKKHSVEKLAYEVYILRRLCNDLRVFHEEVHTPLPGSLLNSAKYSRKAECIEESELHSKNITPKKVSVLYKLDSFKSGKD